MARTLQSLAAPTYTPAALTDSANQTQWESVPTITSADSASAASDDECTIFIGASVQVYYPIDATTATNTACFTGTPQQPTPLPSGYSNLYLPLIFSLDSDTNGFCSASSSVYIIVPAISAGNSYRQVGNTYSSVTLSLAPGDLSTIEGQDGATRAYNFADLPCPPTDIASRDWYFYNPAYNPGRPYEPRISIPPQVTYLDPAWSSCTTTARYQGFDPASALPPGNIISGPRPSRPPRRFRRGAASPLQAPAYANMSASTTMPLTASPTATTVNDPDTDSLGPPGSRRTAQHPDTLPPAIPAATLVDLPGREPFFDKGVVSLEGATVANGPDSGAGGPAENRRRAVEQVDREPEGPVSTYRPTKTFVS